MSPLDCLRGIAAAYVSPVTLLACIILVPAAVAFAVVSYVLRKDWQYQEEEEEIANGGGETDLRAPWRRNTRSQYYNTVENSAPACPLEEELVQMIPVVKYTSTSSSNSCLPSDSSSAIVGGDHCESCVVCLAQFEEEEVVKVLPPCQHSFHAPCIDRWFQTHSTCPLCRRKVLTIDIEAPAPDHHHYHDQQQGMDHHHTFLPPPLQSNAAASAEYPPSSSSACCIVIVIV